MKTGPLSTLLLGALLAGCGTKVDYIALNPPPHPTGPRPGETVEVFMSRPPERPYVEVAMIEAQQQSAYSQDNQSAVIGKMRAEAGKRGCDGLVMAGANDQTVVSGSSSQHGGSVSSATLRGYRATCIVYRQ